MKNLAKVIAVSGPNLFQIVAGGILALTIRYSMLPFESGDWVTSLSDWWKTIDQYGGFPALAHNFSNYNVPYLYLLAMMNSLFPDMSGLTAIKTVSIVFDFVMAIFVYLLVNLKYPTGYDPRSLHPLSSHRCLYYSRLLCYSMVRCGDNAIQSIPLSWLHFYIFCFPVEQYWLSYHMLSHSLLSCKRYFLHRLSSG